MKHQIAAISPSTQFSYPPSMMRMGSKARPSASARMAPLARTFIRYGSVEHLESLFSRLKDGALLIAALAYGLELSISDVCSIRVRDVNIASQSVVIKGRVYQVPKMALEDLREYLQEKLCGYEASVSLSKRDQALFSTAEWESFQREVMSWWKVFKLTQEYRESVTESHVVDNNDEPASRGALGVARVIDRALGLIGRAHLYRAQRKNSKLSNALELFDKGPRIVRRNRYGAVTAYYVWRARVL